MSSNPSSRLRLRGLRAHDVVGALAALGTLALLSPGVALSPAVARADAAASEDEVLSSEGDYGFAEPARADGPACHAGPGAEALTADLQHYIAMMQAEAAQQGAAGEGDLVVLDNRGHNYRTVTLPNPALVEAERRGH